MTVLGYIDFFLNFIVVSGLYLVVLALPVIAAVRWAVKRIRRSRQ